MCVRERERRERDGELQSSKECALEIYLGCDQSVQIRTVHKQSVPNLGKPKVVVVPSLISFLINHNF